MIHTDSNICPHQLRKSMMVVLPSQEILLRELQSKDGVNYWEDVIIRYMEQSKNTVFEERVLLELGDVYMDREDFATAATLYQMNTIQYPVSTVSWGSLAKAHIKMGNLSFALQFYHEVVEINPNSTCASIQIDLLSHELLSR